MKTQTSRKESLVGCCLFGGVGIIVLGIFLTWLFAMGGVFRGTYTRDVGNNDKITDAGTLNLVPLTITLIVIGIVMVAGALFYGNWFERRAHVGNVRKIDYFRILARFVTDHRGNVIPEWEGEEDVKARYYIRGVHPNAEIGEYEVSPEVYHSCGEGMTGQAELQGRWIGRFIPYIGTPPTS
jgi:hypothetical protein